MRIQNVVGTFLSLATLLCSCVCWVEDPLCLCYIYSGFLFTLSSMSIILALRKLRQEDPKLGASLSCIVSSRLDCFKKKGGGIKGTGKMNQWLKALLFFQGTTGFNCQHPHGGWQPSIIEVPWDSTPPPKKNVNYTFPAFPEWWAVKWKIGETSNSSVEERLATPA